MKKRLVLLLSILLILASPIYTFAQNIEITLNGTKIDTDVAPLIVQNRTFVPIRFISEELGYKVFWNDAKRQVTITGDKNIQVKIGKKIMKVDGENVLLEVSPQIIENRTMVPLRAISEAFGIFVDWDPDTRTVILERRNLNHLSEEERKYFIAFQKQFQLFYNNIRDLQITVGKEMSISSKEETLMKLDSIQKDFELELSRTKSQVPPKKFENIHLLYIKSLEMTPEILNGYRTSYLEDDDEAAAFVLSKFFSLQTHVNEINRSLISIERNKEYTVSKEFSVYQKENNTENSTDVLSNPTILNLLNKI